MAGLLEDGQPIPDCNCGQAGDVESVASLTGIAKNLLPYWLSRYEGHELGREVPLSKAAKLVRRYGEDADELALKIFEQQAMALGRLFTIAANFTDPGTYFVGGGVVEAAPHFRDWFLRPGARALDAAVRAGPGGQVRAGAAARYGRCAWFGGSRPRLAAQRLSLGGRDDDDHGQLDRVPGPRWRSDAGARPGTGRTDRRRARAARRRPTA